MVNNPYDVVLDKTTILNILATKFVKKGRDRFMWWRSYRPKKNPLSNRSTLLDRIKNGDFDISSYTYEIQLYQHKINEIHSRLYNDPGRYAEETAIHRRRISKLKEDFHKDEETKIAELETAMLYEFKITKDQYEKEVMNFEGDSILDFYRMIESKYESYASMHVKRIPNYLLK